MEGAFEVIKDLLGGLSWDREIGLCKIESMY